MLHRRVMGGIERGIGIDARPSINDLLAELGTYGVTSFRSEFKEGGGLGFNGSFQVGRWNGDVIDLTIPIPTIEVAVSCPMCNGRESLACVVCKGSGKDYEIDHSQTLAISATFSVIFQRISFHDIFRGEGATNPPLQLLLVSTITQAAAHGGSLHGTFSIPLTAWLATFPEHSMLSAVSGAMKLVHKKLHPFSHHLYNDYHFAASMGGNGWLNITCPGDACGLNPHHNSMISPGRGYEFECHNVDTADQQLVLLSALAALTDLAVAAGVGQT